MLKNNTIFYILVPYSMLRNVLYFSYHLSKFQIKSGFNIASQKRYCISSWDLMFNLNCNVGLILHVPCNRDAAIRNNYCRPIATITINTSQITYVIIPIITRIFPIFPAGYGMGSYSKTAPIIIRIITKISKFCLEIAVIR